MVEIKPYKNILILHFSTSEERRLIYEGLSFLDPNRNFATSFLNGRWDGYRRFLFANNTTQRGFHQRILKILEENSIEVKDYCQSVKDFEIDFGSLWDHQKEALQAFFKKRFGIINIPTQGGKTNVAIQASINILREHPSFKILFLTDSTDLFTQSSKRFEEALNIPIGSIKRDKWVVENVNIAMIQTISRCLKNKKGKNYKRLLEILGEVDFLIIDEVHEFSSLNRKKIITSCENVNYLMALSATPYDELAEDDNINNILIESITGGVIYEIPEEKLVENKTLAENEVLIVSHSQLINYPRYYTDIYEKFITNSQSRNLLIKEILEELTELNLSTLVFVKQTKHGENLSEITGYDFVSGKDKKQRREEVLQQLINREKMVVICSDIWKKGITIPEVEVLFNCAAGESYRLTIQKRGRALGLQTKDGQKERALVIDFDDLFHSSYLDVDIEKLYLPDHSQSRIKAYELKVGQEKVKYLSGGDRFFIVKLKKYLEKWFQL